MKDLFPVTMARLAPVLVLMALQAVAAPESKFPLPGEWPAFRRNPSLDARSPIAGVLEKPGIAWKVFTGTEEHFFVANAGEEEITSVVVNSADPVTPDALIDQARWGLAPPVAEIGGTVQAVVPDAFRTYAEVFPDFPGLEKLEVFREGTVACFRWDSGAWKEIWRSAPMDFGNSVTANPIAGDFDGDGRPELAFLPWWHLVLLDARSGAIKHLCRFAEGRSYGYLGAHDLDGDGRSEFLVQGDFAKHVDVLGWRDGKLAVLWQRAIEPDISNPQSILRVYGNVVADVDGDGAKEVLINTFNYAVAGRWALTAVDGITGADKCVIPDVHFQDALDVNGDGICEVMVTRTPGVLLPEFASIAILRLRTEGPECLWEKGSTAWATWEPPLPLAVNSGATYGARRVLARLTRDGLRVVVRGATSDTEREDCLEVCTWRDAELAPLMRVTGFQLMPKALDESGALLLSALARPGQSVSLTGNRAAFQRIAFRRTGVTPGVATFAMPEDAECAYIAVQGSVEANHNTGELLLLRQDNLESAPAEIRRIRGRSQASGWPQHFGPVFADLPGSGRRQLLYAATGPGGCARLVAEDVEGGTLWSHDFENIPGTPPVWNSGGLLLWQTAHTTDSDRHDVLVSIRRSMMHSEETVLLSGSDGRELWRCARQVSPMHSRGVGGTHFALADCDRDRLDDVVSFYPSLFFVLKGSTGANLHLQDAAWDAVSEKPIYYGRAVRVGDASGEPAFFMAGTGLTALVKPDGQLVWADESGKTSGPYAFPMANTQPLAVAFGLADGARAWNVQSGAVQWASANLPGHSLTEAATANLNQDADEEIILTAAAKVYCIAPADGTVLWEHEFSALAGPPSIVQFGGSPMILVQTADGWLYAIGESERIAPDSMSK